MWAPQSSGQEQMQGPGQRQLRPVASGQVPTESGATVNPDMNVTLSMWLWGTRNLDSVPLSVWLWGPVAPIPLLRFVTWPSGFKISVPQDALYGHGGVATPKLWVLPGAASFPHHRLVRGAAGPRLYLCPAMTTAQLWWGHLVGSSDPAPRPHSEGQEAPLCPLLWAWEPSQPSPPKGRLPPGPHQRKAGPSIPAPSWSGHHHV